MFVSQVEALEESVRGPAWALLNETYRNVEVCQLQLLENNMITVNPCNAAPLDLNLPHLKAVETISRVLVLFGSTETLSSKMLVWQDAALMIGVSGSSSRRAK